MSKELIILLIIIGSLVISLYMINLELKAEKVEATIIKLSEPELQPQRHIYKYVNGTMYFEEIE